MSVAGKGMQNTKVAAAVQRGNAAHGNYSSALGGSYTYNKALPSGLRPDAVDFANREVRELKPDNPRAIAKGIKQVEGYRKELESIYGGKWTAVVDTYKP